MSAPTLNTTYFGYDAEDRLLRLADAMGRTLYFEYDAVGNFSREVGAEKESASYTYDAGNRRTNIAYTAAGSVIANGLRSDPYYVYDAVGNLTQMGDCSAVPLHRQGTRSGRHPLQLPELPIPLPG